MGGGVGWGRSWPLLQSKLDFQDKTIALMVLERHEGFFCVCLWVIGQSQLYCHNRMQAGEPQKAAELALVGQRSTGEGRQVDRANLLVTVAAGMFWQIQSYI